MGYRGRLDYSVGIALKAEIEEINVIKGMVPNYRWYAKKFKTICRFLDLDFQELPMVANSPLPEWLDY